MKGKQAVFNVSRVVLGTSHLVFQTLADMSLEAEVKVIKRTGYWENGRELQLTDEEIQEYKKARVEHTIKTRAKMSKGLQRAHEAFDKQFKTIKS